MTDHPQGAAPRQDQDATVIRDAREFYRDGGSTPARNGATAPASDVAEEDAPTREQPKVQEPGLRQSGSGPAPQPILADRIMRKLPAPPEKASAQQAYEQKMARRRAELDRQRADLKRQDEERARAKQPPTAVTPSPASPPAAAPAAQPQPRATTRSGASPAPVAAAAGAAAAGGAAAGGAAAGAAASTAASGAGSAGRRQATTESMAVGGSTRHRSKLTDPQDPVPARVSRRTRKARLRLARVDPWSVMKTFFLFSIAGGIMACVAVFVVFTVIEGSGLFDSLDQLIQDALGTPGDDTPFQVRDYLSVNRVMGITALLACVDVVILTALATLGSFLYNLSATMLGGLEVTLAED
ncbi:DUF3566 domain-containing protein [Microlunatus sp. Y2014]|uniref:DUF3566 domain-containing protein n=1 Tax=Microlunatus sp. Y2014 TaxID=3418488 RepID=UPI003DA6E61D